MAKIEGGFASLGAIGVTVGPGSFTGIRIGLALARAMGLALDIPVIGVSTLVAFAAPLLAEPQPGRHRLGDRRAARRASISSPIEATGRPLFPPRVGALREAIRGDRRGAGALRRRRGGACSRPKRGATGSPSSLSPALYPDIDAVALIGLAADPATSPPRPLYIKPPDAKPAAGEAIARVEG